MERINDPLLLGFAFSAAMTQAGPAVTVAPCATTMPRSRPNFGQDTPPSFSRTYVLAGQPVEAPRLPAGLHLVATPIGNLRDITLRALETLAAADVIACEDTRVTRKLLDHYGIATPLTPYHEHNAAAARPKLLARLAAGEAIALVSDAGTPLISDPGFKLVRAACEAGHAVDAAPGASAALAALAVAGSADRPVLLRGLPAAEGRRAPRPHRRAEPHPGDADPLRKRPARRPHARGAGRRPRARARPRSAASSPSCTRRCAAASSQRWREAYQGDAEIRGEFTIVVAPPAADAGTPDAGEVDALLRRALQARLGQGRGQRRRRRHRPAAPRNLSARAGAQRRRRWRGVSPKRRRPRRGPERVAAHFTGLSAESRAAAYLVAKGYRIVARRFRSPVGEVDIVARRRGVLVFVEVKARTTLDDAA